MVDKYELEGKDAKDERFFMAVYHTLRGLNLPRDDIQACKQSGIPSIIDLKNTLKTLHDEVYFGIIPPEAKIISETVDNSKGVVRTISETPIMIGGGLFDGAKKVLGKLYHSAPVVAPEEKPKEEA